MSLKAELTHNHELENKVKYLEKKVKRLNNEMRIVKQHLQVLRDRTDFKLRVRDFEEFPEEGL